MVWIVTVRNVDLPGSEPAAIEDRQYSELLKKFRFLLYNIARWSALICEESIDFD